MITITDNTNYIEFTDGLEHVSIPKGQLSIKLKGSVIKIFREGHPPISIRHEDVTLPAEADITALYNTLISYL